MDEKDAPRPEGFDYSVADPEEQRCFCCNLDGFNRSGLMPIAFSGALTTYVCAVPCPNRCTAGLRR